MTLTNQQVHGLLVATRETHDDEIDCEQFLTVMAEYVEARHEGRGMPAAFAQAEQHERLCANCREEAHALAGLLAPG
jgi:hypothetical protein